MASPLERFKAAVERLVFAGLKPDDPAAAAAPKKSKIEAFIESAEELASKGLKPDEQPLPGPTTWTKKLGIAIGILLIGVFVYVLIVVLNKPAEQAEKAGPPPKPVEIVKPGTTIDKNKDFEVVEIEFNKTKEPKEITGMLRNLTDKPVAKCEVSFNVTTRQGEQLGGVVTTVTGLEPHGSARFKILVPYEKAGFALVRELRPE
jgi:hypothetical protein